MTLSITHAKVSGIPDNAQSRTNGEVLPSDWNAPHTLTGTVSNSQIENPNVSISGHLVLLGGSVTLAAADVSLGNVTNDAQTKAAVVPNTAPSAGQVLVGNAGGTAYAPTSIGGDAALSAVGALTVTKTNGVAFGTAATKNIGTVAGTVAAGDDSRIVGAVQTADTDISGASWVLNETDMVSNSAVKVPTQHSVKTFVDTTTADLLGPNASVSFGSFWPDKGASNAKIYPVADRLFPGDGALYDGTWNVATSTGLSPETKKLHGWAPRDATIWCDHHYGTMAIVGHAQASKGVTNGYPGIAEGAQPGPIGVSGFAIVDNAASPGWGGYFEAVQFAGAGFSVGMEVAVARLGSADGSPNPFNLKSGAASSFGIWIQSGNGLDAVGYDGSYGAVSNAAAAIAIVSSFADNSVKFNKGIVIGSGALTDLSGSSSVFGAIDMPVRHQISWIRSDGTQSGFVWSDDTASGAVGLIFKQGYTEFTGDIYSSKFRGNADGSAGAKIETRGGSNTISFAWDGTNVKIYVDNTLVKTI